jgi:hypothetical protein
VWCAEGKVLVCDPTQKLGELAVAVGGPSRVVKLPQGALAGTPLIL